MKETFIKHFKLRFVKDTKHNEIYYSDSHVWIFNRATKECRVKPRL